MRNRALVDIRDIAWNCFIERRRCVQAARQRICSIEALFFAVVWGAAGVAVLHWSLRP